MAIMDDVKKAEDKAEQLKINAENESKQNYQDVIESASLEAEELQEETKEWIKALTDQNKKDISLKKQEIQSASLLEQEKVKEVANANMKKATDEIIRRFMS